tara:strand:+ start:4133 stop:4675 length:543 start_codon:yes stop_codon:yes gene_type:complete
MYLANYITLSRILLIFPVLYLFTLQTTISYWISLICFVIAGITDHLDGYVARKTNSVSELGALLDLMADKLLICIPLIYLLTFPQNQILIFPSLLIISRELVISTFRQYLVEKLGNNPIQVSFLAKTKTTLQIVAISFLIISPNFGDIFFLITIITFWIAAYISIHSFFEYFFSYKNLIK